MKQKSFLVCALLSGLALAGAGAALHALTDSSVVQASAANDTSACNTPAPETTAVTVNYDGVLTPRYGIQAYAGISGPAWIVGDETTVEEAGHGHLLGSNHGDGRTGLTFTFAVNSTVADDAYLRVYGRFNEYSTGTYTVNGGSAANFNLRDMSAYSGVYWNEGVPAVLPISLEAGANTIQVVLGEDYTGWFSTFSISSAAGADNPGGPNETFFCDGNAFAKDAITIPYDGTSTIVYGIQSYAGLSGPAWIVSELAPSLQDGTTAHSMGSNAGDGRSGFQMTFKINSTVAGNAHLNVYAKIDGQATSGATLVVNGVSESINFYDLNPNTWNNAIPTQIPVALQTGLNVITITLQSNYTLWVGSWSVTPIDAPEVFPSYSEIVVGGYKEKGGYMSVDAFAFGLNAFDNAADYGKTGSVTYKFMSDKTKSFYLDINAMAGNNLANRIRITVNEQVQQFNGHNYLSLDTSKGWGGDTLQTVTIPLQEGLNTLVFENELTWVNSAKSQEVEPDTAGAVQVSNWWVHGIAIYECFAATDVSYLVQGGKIILASGAHGLAGEQIDGSREAVAVSSSGSTLSDTADATEWTLGVTGRGYTLLNGTKYMIYDSVNDSLADATAVQEGAYWLFVSDGGAVAIVNADFPTIKIVFSSDKFVPATSGTAAHVFIDGIPGDSERVAAFAKLYLRADETLPDSDTGACRGADGYYAKAKAALAGDWASVVPMLAASGHWARYVAWGLANGEVVTYSNGAIAYGANGSAWLKLSDPKPTMPIVMIIIGFAVVALAGCAFIIRRRKNK